MNEYQEKALFQRFKDSYKDFPDTLQEKVCEQDQPDSVILTTDNKKIGIELTEMYQDNKDSISSGSDLKKTEMAYEEIGNSVVEKVSKNSIQKFNLDISFHRNANFGQANKQKIIKKLSSLIIKYLPTLEPEEIFTVSDFRKLPDGVNDICILTHPNSTESLFANSQTGGIMDLTNEHIETVLKDKNEKIEEYEECDEQWLVIKIGHFLAGSFAENKIDKSFKTRFDKIFVHNTQTSKTVELEVQKKV